MPVVAVIGGIASAAGAASGAMALLGGTVSLSTVAAGLSFVGGVASALGGITGNKKLMKFGMIAGLGGAAMGGLSGLMGGADAASKAASSTAGIGAMTPTDYGLTSGASAATSGLGVQIPSGAASSIGTGFANAAPAGLAETATGLLGQAGATSIPVPPPNTITPTPLDGVNAAGNQAVNPGLRQEVSMGGSGTTTGDAPTSLWDKATGLLKNPELMKVGMGALQGMSQQKAAQAQLEYQEALRQKERDRFNQSILGQTRNY